MQDASEVLLPDLKGVKLMMIAGIQSMDGLIGRATA